MWMNGESDKWIDMSVQIVRTLNWTLAGLIACLLAVSVLAACGDSKTCAEDSDCFAGEICSAGVCAVGQRSDMPTEPVDEEDVRVDFSTPDMGAADLDPPGPADMDVSEDASQHDATVDAAQDAREPDMSVACIVDPFDECVDDENPSNNSFPGEMVTSMTRGCPNDFVPLDMTIDGAMCQREDSDIYSFIFYECETAFIIEATLTPTPQCAPELIHFDIGGFGGNCESPGETLECETFEDGTRRIRLLVPGTSSGSGSGIYFYVQTDEERNDIAFDYSLRLQVRR